MNRAAFNRIYAAVFLLAVGGVGGVACEQRAHADTSEAPGPWRSYRDGYVSVFRETDPENGTVCYVAIYPGEAATISCVKVRQ